MSLPYASSHARASSAALRLVLGGDLGHDVRETRVLIERLAGEAGSWAGIGACPALAVVRVPVSRPRPSGL